MRRAGGSPHKIPKVGRFKKKGVRKGVRQIGKIQRRINNNPNMGDNRRAKLEGRMHGLQDKYSGAIERRIGKIDNRTPTLQEKLDSGEFSNKRNKRMSRKINKQT